MVRLKIHFCWLKHRILIRFRQDSQGHLIGHRSEIHQLSLPLIICLQQFISHIDFDILDRLALAIFYNELDSGLVGL